jgi:regulator of sigma D
MASIDGEYVSHTCKGSRNTTPEERLLQFAKELDNEVPSDNYVNTSDEDCENEKERSAELKKLKKVDDSEFVIMDELIEVVHNGDTTKFRVKESVR